MKPLTVEQKIDRLENAVLASAAAGLESLKQDKLFLEALQQMQQKIERMEREIERLKMDIEDSLDPLCSRCEEVQVKDEGMMCNECLAEEAEFCADMARDTKLDN